MPIFELRSSLTALPCVLSTLLRLCAAIFPRVLHQKKGERPLDRSPLGLRTERGSVPAQVPVRQPAAYVSRTNLEYGTALTVARMLSCLCRSTVTLFVPPSGSPHTSETSSPSCTFGSTMPSDSIDFSL